MKFKRSLCGDVLVNNEPHYDDNSLNEMLALNYEFPGSGFAFTSDSWNLTFRETRAVRESVSTFHFGSFDPWMKNLVKGFLAWCITVRNFANGTVARDYYSLASFQKYLRQERPTVDNITKLDRTVSNGFIQWSIKMSVSESALRSNINLMTNLSKWLRKKTGGFTHDFSIYVSPYVKSQKRRSYLDGYNKSIPEEVLQQIMIAIANEEKALYQHIKTVQNDTKRSKNDRIAIRSYTFLMYCQVLKCLVATGRRVSHIINVGTAPLREPRPEDARGVWFVWNETKTRQGLQQVFVPEPMSEIVREAVQEARRIGAILFPTQNECSDRFLFTVRQHGQAQRVSYEGFSLWLKGASAVQFKNGFSQRHNICYRGEPYKIQPHGFRHARSSALRNGNAGYGTIKNDLAHMSADMTSVYIHAEESVVKELAEFRERQTLFGQAAPLLHDKSVKIEGFNDFELNLWHEQGMFVHPTHYGYCILPQELGTCPVGDPCWIGPTGDGCKYHLYGPTSMENVQKDIQLIQDIRDKLATKTPDSPQIGHYDAQLKRYKKMNEQVNSKLGSDDPVKSSCDCGQGYRNPDQGYMGCRC